MKDAVAMLQTQILSKAKEIHTDSYQMSVGEIISLYKDKELDIHPEFQRFFRWTMLQRTKFIESILLGIPIPSIFVSQRADGVWDVIDGVQRLSTIFQFLGILRDENGTQLDPLVLEATQELPALEGMFWDNPAKPHHSFPSSLRMDFKRHKMDVKIVKKESDANTKYDLFERLNTLGSRLSDQEVRNCLLVMIDPTMHKWLEVLSRNKDFCETTALSDRAIDERYDMELALRFLSLVRASDSELRGVREFDEYITNAMKRMASGIDFDRNREARVFARTFAILNKSKGERAFIRQKTTRGRGGFLISMFETVAIGLGYRIRNNPDTAVDARLFKASFKLVWNHPTFKKYSGSGQTASTRIPRLVPLGRELFSNV